MQSRARRQQSHWLGAVTPRGAAAAASADWRAAGIQRGARERVHAAGAAPEPPASGWATLSVVATPPLSLRCRCRIWGRRQPQSPPAGPGERARKARSSRGRPHRPPPWPHTAAVRALAPLPSPPGLICISHGGSQSGLVSLEADGFCLRGKGVAGGACAAVADLNRGFYCCSLFPPPSLLFSLFFLFFPP